MNSSEILQTANLGYLAAVDDQLSDLAPTAHAELVAQVEDRLRELRPNEDAAAVLGPPAVFAAELRHFAGFPPTQQPSSQSRAGWLQAQARRPVPHAVFAYLGSPRPAWWAARGYLLVALVLAVLSQGSGWGLHTIGSYSQVYDVRGEHALGRWAWSISPWLLLVMAAVVASVALGLGTHRLPPPARLTVAALDALAVVALLAYPTWWMAPAFAYFSNLAG